ncbi:MAG: acetolactate decarboxylase [Planctomycetota bacterium]
MARAATAAVLLGLVLAPACGGPGLAAEDRAPVFRVESWGTMREALRDRHSEARVRLGGLASDGAIGVGALAGLAGEVTIANGSVWVARVDGGARRTTEATADDAATLLVRAEVASWREVPLPDLASYDALESAVAAALVREGFDPSEPTPVRVTGRATHLELHVIHGACPIAHPEGPPPWRFAGAVDRVELVGFHVEGAGGSLTHHGRRSHLHVLADGGTGHLDAVSLEDAVLYVPTGR